MKLPQINLRPTNMTDVYLNHHLYSDHPSYYKRNKMSSVVIIYYQFVIGVGFRML
ncbi:hypothetical protein HanRHA438_Chr06g0274191 [Helianthus annuus]|uniref:Uncharacterized protein n=1 Tax=Helianthus annuus TaxID=4232 RepID=A0A9K3ITU6_HELAN|nr:hypothetical protein HanXRQr2_Chr06g0265011 [Helianthus annuus]KAJ0567458.1 hypothetical protein HanIR_Chr06g0285031 [Helianthus annuus]KAJ0912427.1 hypothetical protein HanRHA438_Chr06g0274191 [Helianthus annuus]